MTDAEAFKRIRDWMMLTARIILDGSTWTPPERMFPPEVIEALTHLEGTFRVTEKRDV